MEFKLPKFLGILIDIHPKAFKEYIDVIVKKAERYYILKLIEKKVTDSNTCVKILMETCTKEAKFTKIETSNNMSSIVSQLVDERFLINNISDSQWGLICLGALGYIGGIKTVEEFLFKELETSKSDNVKLEAARAIGNITSRHIDLLKKLTEFSSRA